MAKFLQRCHIFEFLAVCLYLKNALTFCQNVSIHTYLFFNKMLKILTFLVVLRTQRDKREEAVENLKPMEVPGTIGPDGQPVKVVHKCVPSMIDGKVRRVWSDVTTAMTNCPICGASPEQMGRPKGELHDFEPVEGALKFASFGIHTYCRSQDWWCKCRFHADIRSWSCK